MHVTPEHKLRRGEGCQWAAANSASQCTGSNPEQTPLQRAIPAPPLSLVQPTLQGLGSASAAGLAIIALLWAAKQGYIVPILGMALRLLCCSGPSSHRSKAKKVAPAQPPPPPEADATVTLDAGAASKTSLPPAGPTAAADSGALLGTGSPPLGFKRLSSLRKSWLWPGRFMPGGAGPPVMPTDSMYDQAPLPHHSQVGAQDRARGLRI